LPVAAKVPRARLHLDADASHRGLHKALLELGHDVTRTPTDWMPPDASDEQQLLGATAQGRCILTFNIRDFVALAKQHPRHAGIILAFQQSWTLSEIKAALHRLLSTTEAADWTGAVRWLNDWRE
jgi:hypothetical protein